MTDLEMTRLCAEAMGVWHCPDTDTDFVGKPIQAVLSMYDPLHDDAQAMALVKRFGLEISQTIGKDGKWSAWDATAHELTETLVRRILASESNSTDLNRAIVECVAKMQRAKK